MELVCPPWLRVVRSDTGNVLLHDRVLRRRYTVDPKIAELLDELSEPTSLAELTGSEAAAIPANLVSELIGAGFLAEAGGPLLVANLFFPFQPTFLSCPDSGPGSAQVSVIGMPCEALSTTGSGPAEGPAALRVISEFAGYQLNAAGVPAGFFDYESGTQILEGISFRDLGDIRMRKGEAVAAASERLSHAVFLCRQAGSFPLVLGGDHSLTHAAVRGAADGPIDLLHLDAHSDIMEIEDGLLAASGSVVRALLQEDYVRRVVTVGLRSISPVEQKSLRDGHTIVSARRFREIGAAGIAELLSDPCYISLDLDVIDPAIAQGTNLPVPCGLTMEEVSSIFKAVARRVQVIGADVVELSPRHDIHMRTARVGVELSLRLLAEIFAGLGEKRNGKLAAALQS